MANQYHQLPVDVSGHHMDSQPVTNRHWSKKGMAIVGGSCLALLGLVAVCASTSALSSSSAVDSMNLLGMSRSLRSPFGGSVKPQPGGAAMAPLRAQLINSSPWAKYAIAAVEATNLDGRAREVAMSALKSGMDDKAKSLVVKAEGAAKIKAGEMAGAMAPLGFWDPWGFTNDANEGRLLFLREVELKHGRVCMLASLGILVGEKFHPFFGGNLDMPSVFAPQAVPSATFWPAVFLAIAVIEFQNLKQYEWAYAFPENKDTSRLAGDLGFDPLGLKPKKPEDLKNIQNKEINNGRLAMVAAAGMIAQEWAFNEKIF